MSLFKNIDELLKNFTKEIEARLTIDRPYPQNYFEERRIDWKENGINKAILIQPNFEREGINSEIWNVSLVAWHYDKNFDRHQWVKDLIKKEDFSIIQKNIEKYLKESFDILKSIKIDNLTKAY